jgi:hypothetical protein
MQDTSQVSGNTTGSSGGGGGGVYVSSGTFTKKGGTIYGDTNTTHTAGSTENTTARGNGHAVYLDNSGKKRNSTAGIGVDLYAKYASSWTYTDTSPGGVGDTSDNWE